MKTARIYSYTSTTNENWINKQAKKWGTSKAAVVDAILTEARKNKLDITIAKTTKKKVAKKVAKKVTKKTNRNTPKTTIKKTVTRRATRKATKKAITSIVG